MQIRQDTSLQRNTALSAAVAGKTPLLEATINGAAAEATWELNGADDRQNLTLRVRDQSGSRSSTTFPAVYLQIEAELVSQLSSLKDALQKVAEWRKTVATLYAKIRPWCESLPGNPVVREEPIRVAEGPSGEYDITQLAMTVKGQELYIRPIAAWVVGFDGRVDIRGEDGRAVLVYAQTTISWYHIPDYLPYRELPLTESLFRELVEACLYE